jgi:hypothetical protein
VREEGDKEWGQGRVAEKGLMNERHSISENTDIVGIFSANEIHDVLQGCIRYRNMADLLLISTTISKQNATQYSLIIYILMLFSSLTQ